MAATSEKGKGVWSRWPAIAAIVAMVLAATTAVVLMRPAATVMGMTPLSGLITLKTVAAEAMPYGVAIANQKPTLIEFYADWCTTCQSMSATVDALQKHYGEQINFVMLDIDDPQWAEQIEAFGVSGVPQFTLLNTERQSVNTWVGKVPKPIFEDVFEQVLS